MRVFPGFQPELPGCAGTEAAADPASISFQDARSHIGELLEVASGFDDDRVQNCGSASLRDAVHTEINYLYGLFPQHQWDAIDGVDT
jgi:hypothetical protein